MKTFLFLCVLASGAAQAQSQAAFPKIEQSVQIERDKDRGYILELERGAEKKALDAAETKSANAAPGDREKLNLDVERHKKNLLALDAEISRLPGGAPVSGLPAGPVRLKAASAARPVTQTQTAQTTEVPFWDVYRREKLK